MRDWGEKGVCLGRITIRRHTDKDCHCSRQHCHSRSVSCTEDTPAIPVEGSLTLHPVDSIAGGGEWTCKDTGGRGITIHFKHDHLTRQDKRPLVQGEHTSAEDLFEKGYAHIPSQTVSDELSAVLSTNTRGAAPLQWEKLKAQQLHQHSWDKQV